MGKELFVTTENDDLKIALQEDGRLMEFHQENANHQFAVGDLYLGTVRKLAPSLNAAFVDIGYKKDAFLHYHDLGPQIKSLLKYQRLQQTEKYKGHHLKGFRKEPDTNKNGIIQDILKSGDKILVQVAKEPISTKGPRITSEISLAGRYLVMVPFSDRISVSSKIKEKEEKSRLVRLIESIRPEGFGVIIRTVAENKKVADLHADLNYLQNKWKQSVINMRKAKPPARVLNEMDRASSVLRDSFDDSFVKILVDDPELSSEMKEYLQVISPSKTKIVQMHKNGIVPMFEQVGIEKQIKQAFGKTVNIFQASGAYLVIEHTEALHVIDVNSGNITKHSGSQEAAAFKVNKLAAAEIARQLRLRDMGGIIVVDFIDMRENENKKLLYEFLKSEMQKDRARHKILPPSRFGLIQITRQRVRPELSFKTKEENPNQNGEVEAPILLIEKIEMVLKGIINNKNPKKIFLHVHPFVAAFLKQGLPSIRQKWYFAHKKWIKIVPRDTYKYLQFNFLDENKNTFYNESN